MLDTPRWVELLVQNYVCWLPMCVVWLVGMWLAILRWRRHPQVSLLALLGFGMEIVFWLVMPPVYSLLAHV